MQKIIHVAQIIDTIDNNVNSNVSGRINTKNYFLELRRKRKAYTISRF